LDFVQTQFARGVPNLLKAADRNAVVLDGGSKGSAGVVVVREADGSATRYLIDGVTSRLTRIELQRGRSPDPSGKLLPNIESYEFSDFRGVNDIPTPFKVYHYTNGVVQEQLQFTAIRYIPAARDLRLAPKGAR